MVGRSPSGSLESFMCMCDHDDGTNWSSSSPYQPLHNIVFLVENEELWLDLSYFADKNMTLMCKDEWFGGRGCYVTMNYMG